MNAVQRYRELVSRRHNAQACDPFSILDLIMDTYPNKSHPARIEAANAAAQAIVNVLGPTEDVPQGEILAASDERDKEVEAEWAAMSREDQLAWTANYGAKDADREWEALGLHILEDRLARA